MKKVFKQCLFLLMIVVVNSVFVSNSYASEIGDTTNKNKGYLEFGEGVFWYNFYLDAYKISNREAKNLLYQNKESKYHYSYAQSNFIISSSMALVSGIFLGNGVAQMITGSQSPYRFYNIGIGVGLMIPSFILYSKSKKHMEKAVDAYNQANNTASTQRNAYQLKLISNGNGIGLAFNF